MYAAPGHRTPHAGALRGREDALAELSAGRARRCAARPRAAAQRIELARRHDGGHVDLPDTLARLTEETDAVRRRAHALARGQLERALDGYHALLALDAADAAAQDGVQQWPVPTPGGIAPGGGLDFARAQVALRRAQEIAPDAVAFRGRSRIRARAATAPAATPLPAAERDRRVRQLLMRPKPRARAATCCRRRESAFDRSRAPARWRRSRARCVPPAHACCGSRTATSANCAPTAGRRAPAWTRARRWARPGRTRRGRTGLAQRWLAVGNERLGAGEIERAQRALALARAIDPGVPGLDDFRQRLRAAGAAAD